MRLVSGVIQKLVQLFEGTVIHVPPLVGLYMRPYREVVCREIKLSGLRAGERVLQIGAGSVPFTAIYLAHLAGVRVQAIDIDECAVARGRRCVRRLGLEHLVQVVRGNGVDYPPDDYQVVFVALQAEPKTEILEHFLTNGSPGLRVVVRQPRNQFRAHYDQLPASWRPVSRVSQDKITFAYSLLYVKKRGGLMR
jgi:hypothetical protein